MANSNDYLALVNKQHIFSKSMTENFNMVKIRDTDGATFVEEETLKAFRALAEYMLSTHGIALFLTSAGRSVETQQKVLDEFIQELGEEQAYKRVAFPGTSEHHTGLALDVKPEFAHAAPIQKIANRLSLPEKILYRKQPSPEQKKEMYALLHEALADFGFIQRYTAEKQETTGYRPEPWHIRFVGVEHAKAIKESGMCLEEYVQSLDLSSQTEPGE